MIKKILLVGVLMSASVLQAEVLSWRVDMPSGNASYATAQLFATTTVDNYGGTGSAQGGTVNTYSPDYGVLVTDSNVSGNSLTYFYVELRTAGNEWFGYSDLMNWDTLVTMGALVSGSLPDFPATTAWNAVPEPTSMALLAMGVSALLLRRKRVA